MGLNMPARTVVFTSVRKFDGEQLRWIQGGTLLIKANIFKCRAGQVGEASTTAA